MAQQPFDLGDAGKQTTSTQGTGSYSLDGAAVAPYRSLKAAMIEKTGDATGPWDIACYIVSDGVNRESCSGRLTAGATDTLTRNVRRSTNGNAAVNWAPGVRDIWIAPDSLLLMALPGANPGSQLTIAGGAVTPTYAQHSIDTEGAAATDDLDTLNQTQLHEGARVCLRAVSAARTINVRHNQGTTGKILLRDGTNVLLDSTVKYLELKREGTTWVEVSRSGFAAELTAINRFSKIQKWMKGADVASAATLTLGDDGNYFDITGTTGVTAIASKGTGTTVRLHFDAAVLLTHHATNLVLPGAASYTTAAGDEFEFTEYESGWRCTGYALASGRALVAPATVSAAVQSDQETATSTTVYVSPGTQHFHPTAAKAWVNFDGRNTVTIRRSHQVSSITDNGAGDYTVNFAVTFSDANYCPVGMGSDPSTTGAGYGVQVRGSTAPATTALRVITGVNNAVPSDCPYINVAVFGDL